jgi:hypothetical protein
MPDTDPACQVSGWSLFSRPAFPPLAHRFAWYLKNTGVRNTGRKLLDYAAQRVRRHSGTEPSGHRRASVEPLRLRPGEWVEVKSEEEIRETLDESGRERGMQFMPQMRGSCGRRFQVYKRLEWVFFEESQRRRRIKDTVLLADSICDGKGMGCDRSCYFFWRESWLKRADGPDLEDRSGANG